MIFKLNEHESQDQGLHVSSQSFPRGIFIIGLTGEQVDSSSFPLLTRVEKLTNRWFGPCKFFTILSYYGQERT